jgi:hypothetical protein
MGAQSSIPLERTQGGDGVTLADGTATLLRQLEGISATTARIEQALAALCSSVASRGPGKEWLTTAEFAAEVDRAEFTIRSACSKGRLAAEKTDNGREWRIPRAELARYRRQGLLPARPTHED